MGNFLFTAVPIGRLSACARAAHEGACQGWRPSRRFAGARARLTEGVTPREREREKEKEKEEERKRERGGEARGKAQRCRSWKRSALGSWRRSV